MSLAHLSSVTSASLPPFLARGPALLHLTLAPKAVRTFARLTAAGEAGPDQDPSLWLTHAGAALEQADPTLVRALRHAEGQPVIVVRGLPASPVSPPTPYDGAVDPVVSRQSIVNLHAVLACLGLHPIAYRGEATSILHAVCPVTRARGELSSHGFDKALPFHTDYADRPIDEPVTDQSPAAAALAFAVERAVPETPMECVPLDRLLSALSPEDIRAGQSEAFFVNAPDIFGGAQLPRLRRLLLPDADGTLRCRLNLGKMTGLTDRAARLLRDIQAILSAPGMVERIHVQRGDIVVMDNQRAIHRRASFTPRWDGADRYFIRMSAARDPNAGLAASSRQPWIWS